VCYLEGLNSAQPRVIFHLLYDRNLRTINRKNQPAIHPPSKSSVTDPEPDPTLRFGTYCKIQKLSHILLVRLWKLHRRHIFVMSAFLCQQFLSEFWIRIRSDPFTFGLPGSGSFLLFNTSMLSNR
jgi:hypothetical protein